MALTLIITDIGRAALVNAAHTGTAPVTIASVGLSGVAVAPSRTATNLPGEFKRVATIAGDVVAADTIHLVVRDESSDVFTLRSLGLFLADGTLFGIYGQADPLLEKSSQAMMLISIDVRFEDIAANQVTFGSANFLNPPATTERQGVVELATSLETYAGVDLERAVTPRAFTDALLAALNARFGINNAWIWHPGNDGSGSGLDADLLDGQQGSYYTNIPARLGFTPVNRGGDTMQGLLTVPTIGSQGIATRPSTSTAMEVRGDGTGAAVITFHRPASQAVFFGIDTDNRLKFGGWSMGAVAHEIWHSGNDGAGSGLDADLLDGRDGNYYADIAARLGYVPANRAGDTFTGPVKRDTGYYLDLAIGGNPLVNFDAGDFMVFDRTADSLSLVIGGQHRMVWRGSGNVDVYGDQSMRFNNMAVWHAGNDGAGSTLDADLLDGREGSYYSDITGRLGYRPVSAAGDVMVGPLAINSAGNASIALNSIGAAIGRLAVQADGNLVLYRDNGASDVPVFSVNSQSGPFNVGMPITRQGLTVWDAVNDGAGSGLDADLLDGREGGYYTDITGRLGYVPANRAGDIFSGNIAIDRAAGAALSLNAIGRVIAKLTAQSDGTVALYRNDGGGDVAIFGMGQSGPFNVGMPITRQGLTVWDAANDGAGSGLDADLLDGRDGSFYADIAARLGYVPANRAGDSFSGNIAVDRAAGAALSLNAVGRVIAKLVAQSDGTVALYRDDGSGDIVIFGASQSGSFNIALPITRQGQIVWDAANDGAGSGLDADLLDGRDGGYYADIAARLGYVPANRAGDSFSGDIAVERAAGAALSLNAVGRVIAKLMAQSDGTVALYRNDGGGDVAIFGHSQNGSLNVNAPLERQGQKVWDAANDGAGSGLDADMLDGFQSADFLRIVGSSLSSIGHLRLANGLLLNWGRFLSSGIPGEPVWQQFDRPFAGEPFTLLMLPVVTGNSTVSAWADNNITGEGFNGRCTIASIGCRFFALGLAA